MTQQRYHSTHYDSQSSARHPQAGLQPQSVDPRGSQPRTPMNGRVSSTSTGSALAEPGLQAGDVSTLRFLASRKLRRFDVEGPSPMSLSLNGQPIGTLKPGRNMFEPPMPLNPGDVLQLEVLPAGSEGASLSGWNGPGEDLQAGPSRTIGMAPEMDEPTDTAVRASPRGEGRS